MSFKEIISAVDDFAYVYYVVIKDEPQSAGFYNRDVVSTVRPGAAMDHDGDKVIHPFWVHGVVRLNI